MTCPSELPSTEMAMFLGTMQWHEDIVVSDRPGFRCASKQTEGGATLRAYFDDGGKLAAMTAKIGDQTIELPAQTLAFLVDQALTRGPPLNS